MDVVEGEGVIASICSSNSWTTLVVAFFSYSASPASSSYSLSKSSSSGSGSGSGSSSSSDSGAISLGGTGVGWMGTFRRGDGVWIGSATCWTMSLMGSERRTASLMALAMRPSVVT